MTQNTNGKNSSSTLEKLPVKFTFSTSVVRTWQPQRWSGNAYELAVYCAISPFMLSEDGGLKFNYSVNHLEIDRSRTEQYGPYSCVLDYDDDEYRGEPIFFELIGVLKPQLIKAKRRELETMLKNQDIAKIMLKHTEKHSKVDDVEVDYEIENLVKDFRKETVDEFVDNLMADVAKTLKCEEVFNLRELKSRVKYNILPVSELALDIVRYYGRRDKQND